MSKTFTQMLDSVCTSMEGERIKVGALFSSLNHRGFGPLLLIPTLLVISPVGALPGACAVFGGMIFLLSLQIFLGQAQPWLPPFLRRISFRGRRLRAGIEKIRPFAAKLDKYLSNRLSALAQNEIILRITAFVSMLLSVGIMLLSLIPFAPAAFALPIFLFALGLSVHDGVLIIGGYIVLLLVAASALAII